MKCMSNLTDKFVPSIILFTANFRVLLGREEVQIS